MNFQQIRNATIIIEFAGKRLLFDPVLAEKGSYPGFPGTANSHLLNPTVDLVTPIEEILDVDAVIVTHTHLDHWDDAAKKLIPNNMRIFVQSDADADVIRSEGFTDVQIMGNDTEFEGITISKTKGQHGSDLIIAHPEFGKRMGEVCGVVLRHPDEKTVYIAGDTVWNQHVADSLEKYSPEIIILNCGDAQIVDLGSIIMSKEDVYKVYQATSESVIICSHMEAMNHATLSRKELREFVDNNNMVQRVLIPEDGERYLF